MHSMTRTGRRQLMVNGSAAALAAMTLPGALTRVTAQEATPTQAQEDAMPITETPIETTTGPSEWFTGTVYVDSIAVPTDQTRLSAASVHFTPGSRTAWHTHPHGQTIFVTEGVGLAQHRGGLVSFIRPGDRVVFPPEEEHWHGAAPDRFMTHLALQEVDDEGNSATWGPHVTDEEYNQAPE
jgi:quercetin dioxygenase-like cupin family protein